MREMVDVSTIIGEPMVTGDTTLIPVSKSYIWFYRRRYGIFRPNPTQSCSAAVAVASRLLLLLLLLSQNDKVRLMQINNYTSPADRAISMIPELVDQVSQLLKAAKNDDTVSAKVKRKPIIHISS